MGQEIIVTTQEQLEGIIKNAIRGVYMVDPHLKVSLRFTQLRNKELLTTEEVAELYGLNVNTLKKRRVNGEGPSYIKERDSVFYTHASIRKYLEANRIKTNDQP